MTRFENGKVYQVVCRSTGRKYIGSTTQKYLSSRLSSHVFNLTNGCAYYSVFPVLEANNFYIDLLEQCPCSDINELRRRERFHIESIPCENRNIPGRTKHEWNNIKHVCSVCSGKFTQCHKNVHKLTKKHTRAASPPLNSTNEIVSESIDTVFGQVDIEEVVRSTSNSVVNVFEPFE